MAQYDSLASSYDILDRLPYRAMEVHNVRLAMEPLLRPNMAVLELACGTGFYSSRLLDWGVDSLTAMDISPAMLAAAAARVPAHVQAGRARFVEGDGTKPQSFAPDGSPGCFDLAVGAWFLNYAHCKSELVSMFQSISLNLTSDGLFVGVVPHPTNHLGPRAAAHGKEPLNKMWPRNEYTEELESGDGWWLRVFLNDEGVDFRTCHMKRQVYEEAARLGGMKGKLEWRHEMLLGDEWARGYNLTRHEWEVREANPHLGILVVWKA
ncbi:methyltransferase [Hirsutella rhossiliensis]|uniref:Methyltransferase domain-containing protein n=1 Tax=Hirsutella rhossiliensis TaxID=111463 RepID=A0A9P8N7F5_9HYPO|nr:methyltransferase domain-containing protein [Hirsutella rhossiliensis]KAH0968372.1 methyltransferase domain-containing protein [Hirsutella rhossiliensis]